MTGKCRNIGVKLGLYNDVHAGTKNSVLLKGLITVILSILGCKSNVGTGTGSGTGTANLSLEWVELLGATSAATFSTGLSLDSTGGIVIVGYTNGDIDGNTRVGLLDFYLTKYDSEGTKQFTKTLGVSSKTTTANAVTVDNGDNIFVTGYTTGDLDGEILTGNWDLFLVKYDSDGSKLFTKLLGVSGATTSANAIAVDSGDNIYITGTTTGNLDGNTAVGTQDLFLTKYDNSGSKLFTVLLGVASSATISYGVNVDSSDNVYVVGSTSGGLDGNSITGIQDFFLTKYNSSGSKQYTKQLGAAGATTSGKAIAIDSQDSVYVVGQTNGNLDGNTLNGSQDAFLTKYNNIGVKIFTKLIGAAGATVTASSISLDSDDNLFIIGDTTVALGSISQAGTYDTYVSNFNSSGTNFYTDQFGTSATSTNGKASALYANRYLIIGGHTTGKLYSNNLYGSQDFFIVNFDLNGCSAPFCPSGK